MEFPDNLRYTSRDEWLRLEGEEAVIGITDFAQHEIGPITGLDLPDVGKDMERGVQFGVAHSAGEDWDMCMPIHGRVIARNGNVLSTPGLVNKTPYTDGWLIRIRVRDVREPDALLSAQHYSEGLPS